MFEECRSSIIDRLKHLQSFIDNGLESLNIECMNVSMANGVSLLGYIDGILQRNGKKNRDHDQNVHGSRVNDFILKITIGVRPVSGDMKNSLVNDINYLYLSLIERFNNVMLAFAISIRHEKDSEDCDRIIVFDALNKVVSDLKLTSSDTRLVHAECDQQTSMYTGFHVVLKNRRRNGTENKPIPNRNEYCYIEPRYKYSCWFCQPR